jgi:hypothetical protein
MIQLEPDGEVPLGPSKSSLHTVVHPEAGGGTLAYASGTAASNGASSAITKGRVRMRPM